MPPVYNFTKKIENSHGDSVWSLAWCQDHLVTGSLDGSIKLWNLADTQHPLFTSKKTKIGVTSIVALQDGSMAIACYQDSTIRFFDLTSKQETAVIEPGLLEAYSLSLAPGEDVLASGNSKGGINIWSMHDQHEKVATIPTDGTKFVVNTAFSIDGKLASSSLDGLVQVIDMNTQQRVHKFTLHSMPTRQITFSPEDGDLLYSASDDRMVHLYDLRTGECIQTFGHESMVYCLDTASDGRHFLSGSSDGKVSLWDIGMQKRIQRYDSSAHHDVVWDVGFQKVSNSFSCPQFASVSDDATIHLYEQGK